MRPIPAFVTAALALSVAAPALAASPAPKDPRIAGAYTFQRGGWTYVHLEGSPEQIGFQHGYLLAPEIADALHVFKVEDEHTTQRDWQFFRDASQKKGCGASAPQPRVRPGTTWGAFPSS